jgi:hypothetical protein
LAFHPVRRLTALGAEEVLAAVEPLVDTHSPHAPGVAQPDWATALPRCRRRRRSPTPSRRARPGGRRGPALVSARQITRQRRTQLRLWRPLAHRSSPRTDPTGRGRC